MKVFLVILLLISAWQPANLSAQACCTAGTPIAGSLNLSAIRAKSFHLTLSYEYNNLDDVLAESERIKGFRSRLSQTMLMDISYGLNARISFTALLSYQRQTRFIKTTNAATTITGAGDASLFVKYNLLRANILSQKEWMLGGGLKAPTGRADIRKGRILLSADLQPGSGSWDGIVWSYFSQGYLPVRFSWFLSGFYRLNGTNGRFKNSGSGPGYHFGNEFLFSIGTVYSTKALFAFNLQLQSRTTESDRLGTLKVANTGGKWIYFVPGLNINLKKYTLGFNSQLPVFRMLNGIQLSTTYKISLSLSVELS